MPVQVLVAVARQESGFDPHAQSGAGASGLFQLMPETAQGLGVADVYNPMQSAIGGAKYLRQMYDHYGNWPEALSAYNAGPGNVKKGHGVPNIAETQNYVTSIMSALKSSRRSL